MLAPALRLRYLREMGYQPLRLRSAGKQDAVAEAPAEPAPAASGPTAALPADPLWRALLNAAGAPTASLGALGWEERLHGPAFAFDGPRLLINPIALRQQPAAKRALWKTLRGLRRRFSPT